MSKLLITLFGLTFIIYFLTSAGNTPYNYFTRLADAFLHGRYWIGESPPWLNELVPAGQNRFYVVYPPMPALVAMPLVLIFGQSFPQQYLAQLLGAATVVLTFLLALKIKKDKPLALWSAILVGFGSIVWFLSAVGSVWYLGQITAVFFLTGALLEAFGKKRLLLIGFLLGAAYLSRLQTILALPLFIFLLKEKLKSPRGVTSLAMPLSGFILFNALYNLARFGVPWDAGYFLIPGLFQEPWFSQGLFHPTYIIEHLKIAFGGLPRLIPEFPYLVPSWTGIAIWLTTPAFIYALRARFKEGVVKITWLVILLIWLVNGTHGSTGFAQFGYRFAVDFYPFLFLLTIKGVGGKPRWYHWLLLAVAVVINTWGVIWINKFGWVTW